MHPELVEPWVYRPLPRPVALGRTLFRIPVPLYVCNLHFSQLPTDPDAIELPLDADPKAVGAYIKQQPSPSPLPTLSDYRGLHRYAPYSYERSLLVKRGSFDKYLGKFESKARYNLRRAVKKYCEVAGPREQVFRVFETPDEIGEFYAAARELGARSYQGKIYDDTIPGDAAFQAELADLAARRKQLGALLYHQGKPIAFWWGLRIGDMFSSEYMGFASEQRDLSPGTVLQMLMFEHLFGRDDIAVIDFGEGDLQYKRHFRTDVQLCSEVFYLRRNLEGGAVLALEQTLRRMRTLHKPLLEALKRRGWLGPLRRMISG